MISVLIPTYNVDCLRLVADVQKQCEELQAQYGDTEFDYEILVVDDASPDESIVERNEMIELLPNCTHLRLAENVGRAAARNYLVEQSRFPYILFMDSDAEVCTDDFILAYWQQRDVATYSSAASPISPKPPPAVNCAGAMRSRPSFIAPLMDGGNIRPRNLPSSTLSSAARSSIVSVSTRRAAKTTATKTASSVWKSNRRLFYSPCRQPPPPSRHSSQRTLLAPN